MRSRSAGVVQQTIMRAEGIYELLSALPAPTAIVALRTIVFGFALWTRRAAEWTVAARRHAGVRRGSACLRSSFDVARRGRQYRLRSGAGGRPLFSASGGVWR